MLEWNVVITVREEYKRARKLLQAFGEIERTGFFNVLVLKVNDVEYFMDSLRARIADEPALLDCLGHVMPVSATFTFQSPAEFETKARETVEPWLELLAGKSFHVRMHRRGFKQRMSSAEEERFLDAFIMARLANAGTPGQISFEDPDIIIAVETVAQRAGLALWRRADMQRYPFLQLD